MFWQTRISCPQLLTHFQHQGQQELYPALLHRTAHTILFALHSIVIGTFWIVEKLRIETLSSMWPL